MSLGYGNFDTVIQYDIYSMAESFFADSGSWNVEAFQASPFNFVLALIQ